MSANPPPGFREAWDAFRVPFEWAMERIHREPDDHELARITAADIETFVAEWEPLITTADLLTPLANLQQVALNLRQAVRASALQSLLATLKALNRWRISETFLQATLAHIEMIKHGPPELVARLKAIDPSPDNREFDAEERYREAEQSAEESEAAFRKARASLETNFPDLAIPELRHRLGATPLSECEEWQKTITAEIAALSDERPKAAL